MDAQGSSATDAQARLERLWPRFDAAWIVHRDADVIVIDKPAGVPCQAAREEEHDDLVTRLREFLAAERGVRPGDVYLGVHQRLDRDTSGLVLYALRPEANASLARQFEGRRVDKRYVAIVEPYAGPAKRRLVHMLARGRDGRMEVLEGRRGRGPRRARRAESALVVRTRSEARAELELTLSTGRTHQLRVQLAAEGAPIVGDRLYGDRAAPRLMLHSQRLSLRHPGTDALLDIETVVPAPLVRALRPPSGDDLDLDLDVFDDALSHALCSRHALGRAGEGPEPTTAFRLLHGAAEGVPGVAIDVYDDFLVLHLSSPQAERAVAELTERVADLGYDGVYLKRHPRQKNALSQAEHAALCPPHPVAGAPAPDTLVVHEHGVPFGVRLGDGFSTGLFLDQRDNRQRFARGAADQRVLNLFAYTGAFSTACLHAGAAEAVCVDTSRTALRRADENVARVGAPGRHRTLAMDAFEALAMLARRGERFDRIALDPPSYATAGKRRFVVTRDYPELCARALSVLAPGGVLLACINHHRVPPVELRRMVRAAAAEAGVQLVQLRDLPGQRDFPVEPGKPPPAKQLWAVSAPD